MNIQYTVTDKGGLDLIGPLWSKLNDYHRERSPHHAGHYVKMNFARRKKDLLEKSSGGALRVDLAKDVDADRIVGYCVGTVSKKGQGEVDSIFIEPDYRRQGIGASLMKRALSWMDGLSITQRVIVVASGNEDVFSFYQRYGFFPRATILTTLEKGESG